MTHRSAATRVVRFGLYRFDAGSGQLDGPQTQVLLRPRVAAVLLALLDAAPATLSQQQLLTQAWSDTHVAPAGLARVISELRKALRAEPSAIETRPKRGYRFTLPVTADADSPLASDDDARRTVVLTARPRRPVGPHRWIAVAIPALVLLSLGVLRPGGAAPFPENPPVAPDARERMSRSEFQEGYKAWGLWSPASMEQALHHFRRSARVAPDLWFGYVGIADAQLGRVLMSAEPDPSGLERARAAAERAIQLGPAVAAAHSAFGSVAIVADWDWDGADAAFSRALALNAFSYVTYQRRGLLRLLEGRFSDARSDFERSLELQPDHADALVFLAFAEYCATHYGRALALLERLPDNPGKRRESLRIRAASYAMQARFDEALLALRQASVSDVDRLAAEAWIEARRGNRSGAEEALAALKGACREHGIAWCDASLADAALGRTDEAFASLREGVRRKRWEVLVSAVDPRLAPLHDDPRWDDFLASLGGARRAASLPAP